MVAQFYFETSDRRFQIHQILILKKKLHDEYNQDKTHDKNVKNKMHDKKRVVHLCNSAVAVETVAVETADDPRLSSNCVIRPDPLGMLEKADAAVVVEIEVSATGVAPAGSAALAATNDYVADVVALKDAAESPNDALGFTNLEIQLFGDPDQKSEQANNLKKNVPKFANRNSALLLLTFKRF